MRLRNYLIHLASVVSIFRLHNMNTEALLAKTINGILNPSSSVSDWLVSPVSDGRVTPVSDGLVAPQCDGATAGDLKLALESATPATLLVLVCSPAQVVRLFKIIRENRTKRSSFFSWLVIMDDEDKAEDTLLTLETLILEGTRVQILTKDSSGFFHVYIAQADGFGVIRFRKRGKIHRQHIGRLWNPSTLPQHYSLSGRKMKVASKGVWPVITIGETNADGSVQLVAGFETVLLRNLGSYLNFTYSVFVSPDDTWGNVQPDGTVTGIVGMVARHEVDFAIATVTITEGRASVVDFTLPYYYTALQLVSRVPGLKNRALAVMSPFTLQVWLIIAMIVLLMGPVMYADSYLLKKFLQESSPPLGLQWCSFNMFRNIVVQGNLIRSRFWSQRFLLFLWYFSCLIISALYSGMLTAVLAIPTYETPIDSLTDLPRAVKDGFVVGVMGDSSNENVFKVATSGIFKQTWELFDHKDRSRSFVAGPEIGMTRAMKEKFVFIISEGFSMSHARRFGSIRRYHFGREKFLPLNIGIACRSGFPYVESFSRA
ncbi:glutamate receptor ionotropic, delta-2-like [Palaemon carinicauda]|uniref:glutamate receptor ionotropic, delta-2-like n=1 Tax=Palaemon carinicauda TaxID=392227 RepID=UPI0035B66D5E